MKRKIILIVGPSGAGKDTLLRYANITFKDKLNFVKRYITRQADLNESNYFIDEDAFKVLEDNNYFASHWSAHGNFYGIPKKFIVNGMNIISISRSRIKDFESQYGDVYTINITISKEQLKQRLLSRARESEEEIEKRLSRNYEKIEAKNLIEFDNSGSLEESKNKFIKLLEGIESE